MFANTGDISPLLANIYLHYVLDLWARQWRQRHARGDVIIVRYADDSVVGLRTKVQAQQFLVQLQERLVKFGLSLNASKTRLVEFGRFAARNSRKRGLGKPQVFDFLGFAHGCKYQQKRWLSNTANDGQKANASDAAGHSGGAETSTS